MASQNSALLSSLSSAGTNHPMMMQIGNGVLNMLPNQHAPVFANGISPPNSSAYLSGESTASPQQQSQQKLSSAPATAQTATNSLPVNDSTSDILMEKLYSKSSSMKSWVDLSKSVKQSLLEKRPIVTDSNDRLQLQRCLDTIQNNIEVKSVQSMVERLDTICRQLKLKFNFTKNYECFVSSDMYYVEIKLDIETGRVMDCKVAHQGEPISCPELVDVLQKGNFIEFTKHLEGLSAIYQIDNDKKIKHKAYLALHALESDMSNYAEFQKTINDINNMIHKSPAGIVEPRKGGYPMKMTFFVEPYELIDLRSKTTLPLSIATILDRKIGYSATVCIEESPNMHKLQVESLVGVRVSEVSGKNMPLVAAHTASNTTQLPACFVLKLAKPLPLCIDQARKISKITGIEFPNINEESNLITLMANQYFSKHISEKTTAFYAALPDQNHCYYVNGNSDDIKGIFIEKVAFTHPSHVPRILVFLRQQVLFNIIIGSVIRHLQEIDSNCHIFEISASDLNNIYVQFEHPTEQSLATMDIDLKDITNVKCKLYPNVLSNICSEDYASKIMQKSLSIPVTMRSIINRTRDAANKLKEAMKKDAPFSSASNLIHNQNVSNENIIPNINANTLASDNVLSRGDFNQMAGGALASESQQSNKSQNKFPPSLMYLQQHLNQFGGKATLTLQQQQMLLQQQQQQVKSSKNISPSNNSNNTMLLNMLSDMPHAAQAKSCKKRKRLSSGSGEIVSPSAKRRLEDVTMKQEPLDYDQSSIKLTSSSEMSSSSSISSDDLSVDNSGSNFSNQAYYSIKSGDDGLNEQLKIIKSLEEMPQLGKESTDLPKLILKNEKSTNSIKITKSQVGKSDIDQPTTFRKERKRKRTDSLEAKDFSVLLSGTSGSTSHLDLASPTSNPKSISLVSSSTSGLSKIISQSNLTPPKLKKSNSTIGTSASTIISPVSSPSTQSIKQLPNNITLKYSDKVASILNKSPKSGSLSMLSSTKMCELEAAAAMAVAASSGGSHAVAAAAAAAAVSNFDPKRFSKQTKAKTTVLTTNMSLVSPSTTTTSSLKTSPITLSATPTLSAPPSSLTTNRLKIVQQQSLIGVNSSPVTVAASIKQKNSSSAAIAAASALPMSFPKQIQTSISSQPILQQSSSVGSAAGPGATLLSAQKGLAKSLNKKGSLTAVVDRLRQNASSDVTALANPNLATNAIAGGVQASSPEISSASSNRADSSSSKPTPSGSLSGKSNSDKSKYSRNLDSQFTIKQSNTGLKMSITKTKPPGQSSSASSSALATADLISKIGPAGTGLFKSSTNTKYTIPKIPKTNQSSITSSAASTLGTISGAITSPTLSSTTSSTSTVGSSSPSTSKKTANNASKSLNPGGTIAPGGKTSPAPKMSPKNSGQTKSNRSEKVFKNPDLPPPGSFTKLGQSLSGQLQSSIANNRANVANALFKQSNLAFSMSSNWQQPTNVDGISKSPMITSSSDLYSTNLDRTSVSSSSDIGGKSLPTSTPSSPVESPSMMSDPLKNQAPLIIPTEAIDDSSSSSGGPFKSVDSTAATDLANRLVSADSSSTPPATSSLYTSSELFDSDKTPKRKLSDQTLSDSKQIFFPSGTKGPPGTIGNDFYPSSTSVSQHTTQSIITSEASGGDSSMHLDAETLIGSSDV